MMLNNFCFPMNFVVSAEKNKEQRKVKVSENKRRNFLIVEAGRDKLKVEGSAMMFSSPMFWR